MVMFRQLSEFNDSNLDMSWKDKLALRRQQVQSRLYQTWEAAQKYISDPVIKAVR